MTITLLDSNDAVVSTTTTDANGAYSFTGLRPDTYTVKEGPLPDGNQCLDGDESSDDQFADISNETIANLTVSPGETSPNNNFNELQPATSTYL